MGVVRGKAAVKNSKKAPNIHKDSLSLLSHNPEFDDNEFESEEYEFDGEDLTEDEYLEAVPVQTKEEIRKDIAGYNYDLFVDVGDKRAEENDIVIYEIFKNNQMLTTKHHPYSWEELQKEFGGGSYKITAKSGINKRYIKTQTRMVSGVAGSGNTNTSNDKYLELIQQMQDQTLEQNRIAEEKARADRIANEQRILKMQEEQKKEAVESQNNMMALIASMMNKPKDNSMEQMMAMMQNQGQQNMQMMIAMMSANNDKPKDDSAKDTMMMMMEMQKSNMQMIKDMNDANARQFEKIGEKFERSKTTDDVGGLKLVEMYTGAMNQGFEQMKLVNELAEAKAASTSDDSSENESVTQTLIKSVAPMLGTLATMNNGGVTQNPAPQPTRQVAPPQRQAPQRSNNQNNGNRTQSNQNATNNQTKKETSERRRPAARKSTKANELGLPSADIEIPKETIQVQPEVIPTVTETVEPIVAQNPEPTIIDNSGKDKAIEVLVPVVGQCMDNLNTPHDSAPLALQFLNEKGIDPKQVVPQFNGEELIEIAAKFGLKESEFAGVNQWLKDFYDSLLQQTTQPIG